MGIDSSKKFDQADLDRVVGKYPEDQYAGQPDFVRPTLITREIIFNNETFPTDVVKQAAIAQALDLSIEQAGTVLLAIRSSVQLVIGEPNKSDTLNGDLTDAEVSAAYVAAWADRDAIVAAKEADRDADQQPKEPAQES